MIKQEYFIYFIKMFLLNYLKLYKQFKKFLEFNKCNNIRVFLASYYKFKNSFKLSSVPPCVMKALDYHQATVLSLDSTRLRRLVLTKKMRRREEKNISKVLRGSKRRTGAGRPRTRFLPPTIIYLRSSKQNRKMVNDLFLLSRISLKFPKLKKKFF